MSRDQQPVRVRILSSGETARIGGRRRDDPVDLDGFDADERKSGAAAAAQTPPRASTGLSIRAVVALFLCASALSGASAIALGLVGISV